MEHRTGFKMSLKARLAFAALVLLVIFVVFVVPVGPCSHCGGLEGQTLFHLLRT